ncbi:hypothetical protein GINT2_000451 [Glugoides intestinalis]
MVSDALIIEDKIKDCNERALAHCKYGRKTLIFSYKTNYIPPIHKLCIFKNFIFFTESNDFFNIVIQEFEKFSTFIFVKKSLNDFEKEFINQLREKTGKEILEVF